MVKKRKYPPAYYKYQSEHPPVTLHLNRKVKAALDSIRGNRSYSQTILDIFNGNIDWENSVRELPKNEAVIMYKRGYSEARNLYGSFTECRICKMPRIVTKNGVCTRCLEIKEPQYKNFRNMTLAALVDDDDFVRADVKMPVIEQLSYRNGMKRGYDNGYGDGYEEGKSHGYDEAKEKYMITYNCSECGKPITLDPDGPELKEVRALLHDKGWRHGNH